MSEPPNPGRTTNPPAAPDNPARGGQALPADRLPVWRSEDLFHGEREIVIQHGDQFYRLRRTRHGKLILHK